MIRIQVQAVVLSELRAKETLLGCAKEMTKDGRVSISDKRIGKLEMEVNDLKKLKASIDTASEPELVQYLETSI